MCLGVLLVVLSSLLFPFGRSLPDKRDSFDTISIRLSCFLFAFKNFPPMCYNQFNKTELSGGCYMWFILALFSAIFAALTSILAKVGIDGVNSNLATAIRTVVVVIMAWGMVFLTNAQNGIPEISKKSWLFLILSGLATGASWLCYYKALQIGEASKVVPIDKLSVVITLILAFVFLHEKFTIKSLIGCVLIGAGTLVMVLK